jgi:AcrR family transcriptional regulator
MAELDRRRLILDCAARLFRRHGHAKTGIAEIAREAGVAVGSVYLEFPSKEALVEHLSDELHRRVIEAMRRAASRRAGLAPRLEAVLDARVDTFLGVAAEGKHACDLVHCARAEAVKTAHQRFRDAEATLFIELLAEAKGTGELTSMLEPHDAASLLQLALIGLSPPALYALDATRARATSRALAVLALHGLLDPRAVKRRR